MPPPRSIPELNALTVECPKCHSPAHQWCTEDGKPRRILHHARSVAARDRAALARKHKLF